MLSLGRLVATVAPATRPTPATPERETRLDITLTNGGQTRRYLVRAGRKPGTWRCELVLNGRHGAALTELDDEGVDNFTTHAQRSIAYLEEEGWVRVTEQDARG